MINEANPTTSRPAPARKPNVSTHEASAEEIDALLNESSQMDPDVDLGEKLPGASRLTDEMGADLSAELAVEVSDIAVLPQPELKKKELVDLAVARSGIKKRDAKPAIEAALAVLGEALSEGRELNIIPFGKLKVTRMKKGGNGQIISARVRQPEEDPICLTDPLAQAAE